MNKFEFHSGLVYYDSGGAGLPVLCFHGNSCSSRGWRLPGSLPEASTYRWFLLDFPGHGQSENAREAQTYTPKGFRNLITAWVDFLNLEQFIVLGHSLGGHVALHALHDNPRTIGFLLTGVPPLKLPLPPNAFLPNPYFELFGKSVISKHEAWLLGREFFADNYELPEGIAEDIMRTDPLFKATFNQYFHQVPDEVAIINAMRKPVMLVHGAQDKLVNLDYIKSLELKPHCRIVVLADAGHFVPMEKPNELMAIIKQIPEG